MKEFTVHLHEGDALQDMHVKKLSLTEFDEMIAGGIRQLFELDTNIGFFLFVDAEDHDGKIHYLVMRYEEETMEKPMDIYAFQLEEFYEMVALYLSQAYFDEMEHEGKLPVGEVDGPIYHLAHLLSHVVMDGQGIDPEH